MLKDGVASINGFACSATDAKSRAEAWQDKYPAILNDVETEKSCSMVEGAFLKRGYMGKIEDDAAVDDVVPASPSSTKQFVKLFPGSGKLDGNPFTAAEHVDVLLSVL